MANDIGSAGATPKSVVEITSGKLCGAGAAGVYAFKGVPYGASTTGLNRFMAPRPPQPWSGERDALAYAGHGPQSPNRPKRRPGLETILGPADMTPEGEDCLTLNLWTPGLSDGAKRPVMVWLHGGAFAYGSGNRAVTDGAKWTIISNRSTALLAFVAGKLDMTLPYEVTVPLLKDIESQAPQAICELRPRGVSSTLIVNRYAPPFDNPDLRRAMALSLDRRAFIDVLSGGQGDIGAAMLPPPEGLWGMRPERLRTLSGYDPDVQKNRTEARQIMGRLGYGADNLLAVKAAARNIPLYRDPAVMLIDQLKEIYIAGELDVVETANWNPKITRRDYMVALENTGIAVVDDPDQQFYESFACDSDRNFTGYCNRQLEDLFHQWSRRTDQEKRKELVWNIDATLQEEVARSVIFHTRGATCWHPQVRGLTTMVNSMYNGWRMEDVWLER
jgi:peptide/nickel transport system substrate-binding protein